MTIHYQFSLYKQVNWTDINYKHNEGMYHQCRRWRGNRGRLGQCVLLIIPMYSWKHYWKKVDTVKKWSWGSWNNSQNGRVMFFFDDCCVQTWKLVCLGLFSTFFLTFFTNDFLVINLIENFKFNWEVKCRFRCTHMNLVAAKW